jgi:amylosucrase
LVLDAVLDQARAASLARNDQLVDLDATRARDPGWFQSPERVGYAAYADRFGGDLPGVAGRIGYLQELGVDILHLMSVLRGRAGDNDGGYAIDDYRQPDPQLGSAADLEALIDALRAAGISVCLDLVLNHTSADHEWAVAARNGSRYHRDLYLVFEDRTLPDAYEATLPEVFPTMAPGSFTWVDGMQAWVWTTFREFQWDLNWANPDVLVEMVDVVLYLVNLGVEILRLDAVAFTWKRLGTNCQNQPEAHLIAQVLRAVIGIAAPASILLAEAIVGPDDLVAYLGQHERQRRECQLAYHNQLMVQAWSMVATQDAALATTALGRFPELPEGTTWLTYVRSHDDIGWAVSDRDAEAVGLDGYAHRRFLAEFFRGDFPLSFARGAAFSVNPLTGDERTSGMTSALSGIASGLETANPEQTRLGVDRLLLLYALAFGFGGVPMVYMGDEIGLGDDRDYAADPAHAGDSRWRHRPRMNDTLRAARHDPATTPGAVWAGLRHLVEVRKRSRVLHGAGTVAVLASGDPGVFAWVRRHARFGSMLGVANIRSTPTRLPVGLLTGLDGLPVDLLDGPGADVTILRPFGVRWLTADSGYRTAPAVPAIT